MMRRLLVVVGLLVALGGIAIVSVGGPRLVFPAPPATSAAIAISDAAPARSISVGSIMLCVSSGSTAVINGVAIHDPVGPIQVEAFAVRPNPFTAGIEGLGSADATLAGYGRGFAPNVPQTVSGICRGDAATTTADEAGSESELGVQVRLLSEDIGGGHDLDVTYAIDGRVHVLSIPFGIWLCARTCPSDINDPTRPPA